MNKKLVALITAAAVLAPVGSFAMPVAAPASASLQSAQVERAAIVVRTGPRIVRRPRVVVRRPPVVVRRPAARVIVR